VRGVVVVLLVVAAGCAQAPHPRTTTQLGVVAVNALGQRVETGLAVVSDDSDFVWLSNATASEWTIQVPSNETLRIAAGGGPWTVEGGERRVAGPSWHDTIVLYPRALYVEANQTWTADQMPTPTQATSVQWLNVSGADPLVPDAILDERGAEAGMRATWTNAPGSSAEFVWAGRDMGGDPLPVQEPTGNRVLEMGEQRSETQTAWNPQRTLGFSFGVATQQALLAQPLTVQAELCVFLMNGVTSPIPDIGHGGPPPGPCWADPPLLH
jgi:hypothetical protein